MMVNKRLNDRPTVTATSPCSPPSTVLSPSGPRARSSRELLAPLAGRPLLAFPLSLPRPGVWMQQPSESLQYRRWRMRSRITTALAGLGRQTHAARRVAVRHGQSMCLRGRQRGQGWGELLARPVCGCTPMQAQNRARVRVRREGRAPSTSKFAFVGCDRNPKSYTHRNTQERLFFFFGQRCASSDLPPLPPPGHARMSCCEPHSI